MTDSTHFRFVSREDRHLNDMRQYEVLFEHHSPSAFALSVGSPIMASFIAGLAMFRFALQITLASSYLISPIPTLLAGPPLTTASGSLMSMSLTNVLGNFSTHNSIPSCNGAKYGFQLNLQSCQEALRRIPSGTIPLSFGNRGYDFSVQTPRRISSRKCHSLRALV